MISQQLSKEPVLCYECQSQAVERCSYCLLPICAEHGTQMQPWFTSRVVMVCAPCQAKLEEIARQDQSLQGTARAEYHTALHVLMNKRL